MPDFYNLPKEFSNQVDPRLEDLVMGNAEFRNRAETSYTPQDPRFIVLNCGKLSAEIVFQMNKLGLVFDVAKRGAVLSREDIGSLEYAASHFRNIRFGVILIHSCALEGACRIVTDSQTGNVLNGDLRNFTRWRDGIKVHFMDEAGEIPPVDFLHAYSTAIKILEFAPHMHELVADGNLLLGLGFYDNQSGRISYPAFIGSAAPGVEIEKTLLQRVAGGMPTEKTCDSNPSLIGLHDCVLGNDAHVARFSPPVPTEHVIFGCADSRTSPYIIFDAQHGLLEIIRNAGNVVNDEVLYGMRIAVEDALKHREEVNLVILTHSRCGAVTATLENREKSPADDDSPIGALIQKIDLRFEALLKNEPARFVYDENKVEAAAFNAVGAARDILNGAGPDADYLREMIGNGKLAVFPAEYLLQSGKVLFGEAAKLDQR